MASTPEDSKTPEPKRITPSNPVYRLTQSEIESLRQDLKAGVAQARELIEADKNR